MHSLIRLEDEQKSCAILVDFIPSVTPAKATLMKHSQTDQPNIA